MSGLAHGTRASTLRSWRFSFANVAVARAHELQPVPRWPHIFAWSFPPRSSRCAPSRARPRTPRPPRRMQAPSMRPTTRRTRSRTRRVQASSPTAHSTLPISPRAPRRLPRSPAAGTPPQRCHKASRALARARAPWLWIDALNTTRWGSRRSMAGRARARPALGRASSAAWGTTSAETFRMPTLLRARTAAPTDRASSSRRLRCRRTLVGSARSSLARRRGAARSALTLTCKGGPFEVGTG